MNSSTGTSQQLLSATLSTESIFRNKSESRWSYTVLIAICLLFLVLFLIAAAIVLSLIPLYLPTKDVTIADGNASSTTLNIIYRSNLALASVLNLTDLSKLSKDMSNALGINNLNINNGKFLQQFSTDSRQKREDVDINSLPCSSSKSTTGDWFSVSVQIANKQLCRSDACNLAYFDQARQNIATIYKTINVNMKFTDQQTRSIQLTFCSFGNPIRKFSAKQFLTQCTTTSSGKSIKKRAEEKLKMFPSARSLNNRVLIDNAYLVEFATDVRVQDPFGLITRSLKSTHNIDSSVVRKRDIIDTDLFSGISVFVEDKHAVQALSMIDEIVAIYPVYTVTHPQPEKRSISLKATDDDLSNFINGHNLTGVNQVHNELGNYGKGVRIAVIDSGVDYKHPALGGCFGSGCKVAFGYDFVGDSYSSSNSNPSPDSDPLDSCTLDSAGTLVAGVIAANTTGITQTQYTTDVPFIGVAPQATLGAYRIFGCSGTTSSDIIVKAIYRAQSDNADIITLTLLDADPFDESPEAVAIKRVTDAGVYVVIGAGNDGTSGMQTVTYSSEKTGAMSIGSVDSTYIVGSVMNAANGKSIIYLSGIYGGWSSTTNSTVIANKANQVANDGCSGPSVNVTGKVVLFYYSWNDSCGSTDRCNSAANAGAVGCLLYNVGPITGSPNIPSGSISLADGLSILEDLNANGGSAIYTFTNTINTTKSDTGGTPSSFSSFGPQADLFFTPQLSGIGGNVYSTLSSYSTQQQKAAKAYATYSDTRAATGYVAGTLALFLASIDNPPANTVNGTSTNGICRPPFSLVKSIFQSTSIPVNLYNSENLATAAQQGAGLVNAYQALGVNTFFSPSELSLNDTTRKAQSYTVTLRNIGNQTTSYKLTHVGASLLTGKKANDDQLMSSPIQSADYATVVINPTEVTLEPGEPRNITLQFTPPTSANTALLPIYSGFIYATNSIDGTSVHLSYAGVVGDYGNAGIIVQSEASAIITSIYDASGYYLFDFTLPYLNATDGVYIVPVLAWSTRVLFAEVVSTSGDGSIASTTSYGLVYSVDSNESFYMTNVARNVISNRAQSYTQYYEKFWNGHVCPRNLAANCTRSSATLLTTGQYAIRFAVLKHFGDETKSTDFEIYRTPTFNLAY